MEIVSTKNPRAKKQHTCNYCGGVINIGEIYNYQALADGGSFWVWKSHRKCIEIADKIGMFDGGEGLGADDFQESIRNEFDKIWIKKDTKHYESKDFIIPSFLEQLNFVCEHHKINQH